MGYVDIHAHIIPGIDDGPKTIEESRQMLHTAFEEGFTTIIATPHCSKGFGKYSKDDVMRHCAILNQYAKEHISPEFSVLPGQEIYYNEASMNMIRSGEVLPLAQSNYILLEFDPDVTYSHLLRSLREVSMSPFNAILAHVERYACLDNISNLREIREMGVLTQMNYASITGRFYQRKTAWCRKCLRNGLIDFLATDMHNISMISNLKPVFKWMQNHLDSNFIQSLTDLNAKNILIHNNKG